MILKRWIWVISFLSIACGALVDTMKTVVEIMEDIEDEKATHRTGRRKCY